MKPGIIQKIFSDHYAAVDAARPLDERSRWAAWNILTCRTPKQGFHVDECPNGDYRAFVFNSCKHRSCPLCGAAETELWLERQRTKELRCRHHQVVFTSPDSLRIFWRWNRRLFVNLYFRAAWHTLRELLEDPRWLGALPGVIGVFQSWSDELGEHLHLHFVVTSGGMSPGGKWVDADPKMLIPFPVLSEKFRGKFLAYLREALNPTTAHGKPKPPEEVLDIPPGMTRQRCLNLFNKLGRQRWNVHPEEAYEHAGGALKYIGRYIKRGPISERRIVSYDGKQVVIAYVHPEKHTRSTFVLEVCEFIRRLLQHVPAKGSHCARVYGLYHSTKLEQLNKARAHLGQASYDSETDLPDVHELMHRMFPDFDGDLCPHCHARLVTVFVIRRGRSPPEMEVAA